MEGLSIDQILAESREEIQTFDLEKSASPSADSSISDDEIVEMAEKLGHAILTSDEVEVTPSFEEKVAQALIFNQTLEALNQEQVPDEESEKIASFREQALGAGYDSEEVEAFIEKNAAAGMNMWGSLFNSKGAKVLLGSGVVGGAGFAGHEYGEHKERQKAKKAIKVVGNYAYRRGAKRGFNVGANAANQSWKNRLKRIHDIRK